MVSNEFIAPLAAGAAQRRSAGSGLKADPGAAGDSSAGKSAGSKEWAEGSSGPVCLTAGTASGMVVALFLVHS